MAIFNWDGTSNLDLKILGQPFDFRSDVLQISDPTLAVSQFDIVEDGTDIAIVKVRDANGNPLPDDEVRYAYLPNMLLRQIGGTSAAPATSNVVLSDGGQLWIGDRLTDTLLDDAGNDVAALATQLNAVQVVGLGGADTILTGDGNDRVYGNEGSDLVRGGAGRDSIFGGIGNDTLEGDAGDDLLAGDVGDDKIVGGSGNDLLYGAAGKDVIDPGTGNDTVFAGNGEDTLALGDSDTGDKLVYMDRGQDSVSILSTTGDHSVHLGDNNDVARLEANAGDVAVFGGDGNDTIVSQNFGADTLDGGVDDDVIEVLDGSIGHKLLVGGAGRDDILVGDASGSAGQQVVPNTRITLDAGEGDDTVVYDRGLFIADANDGGEGTDSIAFHGRTDLTLRDQSLRNFETADFSEKSDRVVFADGNVGAGRSMTVHGNDGHDRLDASRETDGTYDLIGGEGDDSLFGGDGDDTLEGQEGRDLLVGGAGSDQFRQLDGPGAPDVIQDFAGGVDRFAIDGNVFGGMSAIDGYKGTAGDGATANDNLLIATGQGYAGIADFDAFLSTGLADTDKPGFYVFFNTESGRAEIWFDTNMTSVDGATLVATFNNVTAVNQLSQFVEGVGGGNSGDFVVL